MRCRRVRSCLSAYCKNELSERRQKAVMAHLEECPECRREEAVIREIEAAIGKLPEYKVSPDFNSRVLSRVAEERFKETRSKAYLPKRAPIFGWGRLVPALATISLVLAFVFLGGLDLINEPGEQVTIAEKSRTPAELDDRYLTVQPQSNHVLIQHANAGWAFDKQLARATRIKNLMNRLAGQNHFASQPSYLATGQVVRNGQSPIVRLPMNSHLTHTVSTTLETKTAEEAR